MEIETTGASVWAITSDDPERLRSFRDTEGIEFAFLLDPEGSTFRDYGVLNEGDDRTIPHPTVVVVNGEGVASYVSSNPNHKMRPPASDIVEAVQALN